MALIRTVVLVFAGIAAGFALALWWLQRDQPAITANQPPPAETAVESRADPQLQSAVVRVYTSGSVSLQTGSGSVRGLVVGAPDIVIAPASLVAGADRLRVETQAGNLRPVTAIAASDDIYGLVALRTATPLDGVAVLQPDTGAGSLFVGRTATLLTADGIGQVEIASPAQRNELGAYYYETRQRGLAGLDGVALLDPDTAVLIGVPGTNLFSVAQQQREPDTDDSRGAAVIDSGPIATLIDAIDRGASRSPAEFSRHYFLETTLGRIALLRTLVSSGRHAQAIRHGESIVNLDAYSQDRVPPLLQQAYAVLARELIDSGREDHALARLRNATSAIGASEELILLQAEALISLNRHEQAIDVLLALGQPPIDRIRAIVVEHALIGGEDSANVRLIERALQIDPDFAPYHRLLGEHYARLGDMPAAIQSLERATRLDASMNADLSPMLERLRARRHTPAVTEIPIRGSGSGTFIVNARINGSQNTYRLLLDTGASYTAISTETALQLGLSQIFLGAPVVELQTANGRIFATTATLESVDVAGARVDNVEAVILESGSWDGLLGQSFLRHFDIEIDRSRNVIAFHRRAN